MIGQRTAPLTGEVREDNLVFKEFRVYTMELVPPGEGMGVGQRVRLRFQWDTLYPRAKWKLAARGCGTPDISLGSEERLN